MPSRCPSCSAFVSVQRYINLQSDWVMCRACGELIHCPSTFAPLPGTRKPEKRPFDFYASKLLPNGKITKRKVADNSADQPGLFGGAR